MFIHQVPEKIARQTHHIRRNSLFPHGDTILKPKPMLVDEKQLDTKTLSVFRLVLPKR
uniref:Uncharacterized protein n=1 Tax=mine drainage metagenome TaxID=410659 RepID=E6QLV2_9ZZZZ